MTYSELDFRSLTYRIYRNSPESPELDEALSSKLNDIELFKHLWYQSCYISSYPKTAAKINEIILEFLKQPNDQHWSKIYGLVEYLTREVKVKLLDCFVAGSSIPSYQVAKYIVADYPHNFELLITFRDKYRRSSSNYAYYEGVKTAFINLRKEDLDKGCVALKESTPAIRSLLLLREDINEENMLAGLKALSKLSVGRKVGVKVKLDMLRKVSPKARLELVKHLIGYSSRGYYYYRRIKPAEFEVLPTKEELAELLFACSLKHNDEVAKVVNYYETYLNRIKDGNYG